MFRRITLITLLALMSACGERGSIVVDPAATSVAKQEVVYIGTTRVPTGNNALPYGSGRSLNLRLLRLEVSIPPDSKPGQVRWPPRHGQADPKRDMLTIDERIYPNNLAFRSDFSRSVAQIRKTKGDVVLFVHGFNTNFAEGAYRMARLAYDLDFNAVSAHYSWSSEGKLLGYAYDRDSALFARDGLQAMIHELIKAGAGRIVLIAHSMGGELTVETLRQMAISGDTAGMDHIAGVFLISPDIDVDVFRAQATRIGKLPQPFVIFKAGNDEALAASTKIAGGRRRLGNIVDLKQLAGLNVAVIDTSNFKVGIGHFDAGSSPEMIKILSKIRNVNEILVAEQTGIVADAAVSVRSIANSVTQFILP